jgi:dUTP pyrophosphatase
MLLNGKTIEKNGLIEGMKDRGQIQPAGIDLTLAAIHSFDGMGILDLDNSKRKLPLTQQIHWGAEESVSLEPGTYKIIFNEIVSIPKDCAAIARPRSSLLRCGATVNTAVWDPGYRGRSEALLVVSNPAGVRLYKDAKLIQLVFLRLEQEADKIYSGVYQGENTK